MSLKINQSGLRFKIDLNFIGKLFALINEGSNATTKYKSLQIL